ncbi:hypothetical protein BH24ACI2_BH24ACI2_01410 [soil metagenome]|nr:zf-HC2 domain-containing protein [Acidobacteriota bacterium]
MREKCFEIGTIQAFLDGELTSDLLENVARHVAACKSCALLLAEAEEESAVAFSALEQEFNTLVPTQRLWTKINDSIERERKPLWQTVFAFFSNPTVTAFASLLIVFGIFAAILSLQNNNEPINSAAQNAQNEQGVVVPVSKPGIKIKQTLQNVDLPETKVAETKQDEKDYQVIKAAVVKKENNQKSNFKPNSKPEAQKSITNDEQRTADENLLGEESYVKTIATLEKTVNSRKDEVLKPSSRFAYEKDLAVVDDAITKMKAEVRKNPKNEAAKDVLRASYQNKIDLLSSVTEKTELMASLK